MPSAKSPPENVISEQLAPASARELIVVARPEATFAGAPPSFFRDALSSLRLHLVQRKCVLEPLFLSPSSAAPSFLSPFGAAPSAIVRPYPEQTSEAFFYVLGPDEELDSALEAAREHPAILGAYIKPPATEPILNLMAPSGPAVPQAGTPDFEPRQGHLQPAPGGVDARFAWNQPGGKGATVRIIDLEWGWLFNHEDLQQNSLGLVLGTNYPVTDHGTAVLGEMVGTQNGFGVTGICPDATFGAVSFNGNPTARAITQAATMLNPGDILLLEIHRPGPRFNYASRQDQKGFIAIEWWPDDFAAIRAAVSRGVIVVEAAGNGGEDLDDPIYEVPDPGFPRSWMNSFNRANRDSGAILVGAGAPPGGEFGPDRSRLDFSNFGLAVDAQGWGRGVVTTGYGDLQAGPDPAKFYTAQFAGTSSAAPIVAGSVSCLQGVMRANAQTLSPNQARRILRVTGSPQVGLGRIGNRPDLKEAISLIQSGIFWPSEPPI